MQALILAAGLGTRLKPITNHTPKCLVEINGRKLIDIWLDLLRYIGGVEYLLNTHHLSEQVEEHLKKHSLFKSKIKICYEKKLLGTAGTLLKNISSIRKDLIFLHADNYTNDNLKEFVTAHNNRPSRCLMTMLNFRTNEPKKCGIIKVDKDRIMTSFVEKPKTNIGNLANGAIYIMSKKFIDEFALNFNSSEDFSADVLPNCTGKVYTYETKNFFIDIGSPESLDLANRIK